MITEEIYRDEKEINKAVALMCANNISGSLKDRDVTFSVRFKEFRNGQVYFSQVDTSKPGVTLDKYNMRPLDAEVFMGGNVYLFTAFPMTQKSISMPESIKSHPKRKNTRIKVAGNPFISKMYTSVAVKVVDPTIQDEELSKKIQLIINTIESTLVRSENFDIAKINLFDGTEKNTIIKLLKKYAKAFVVFDTANLSVKDESILTYEDYVKFLSEEGNDFKEILAQLDKIKEFYQRNKIKSEAIIPLIFEEEVIGQIKVISMKESIIKPNIMRLNHLALNAVDNLFTKCAFEITTKEPQIIMDMASSGSKIMITDPALYKYIHTLKRIYMQITFPDESIIKTMATVMNEYPDTEEGYKTIGVKFSSNIDWKDKAKLDEFIQSVVRLQNTDFIANE